MGQTQLYSGSGRRTVSYIHMSELPFAEFRSHFRNGYLLLEHGHPPHLMTLRTPNIDQELSFLVVITLSTVLS